jgi:hypothetical protein
MPVKVKTPMLVYHRLLSPYAHMLAGNFPFQIVLDA